MSFQSFSILIATTRAALDFQDMLEVKLLFTLKAAFFICNPQPLMELFVFFFLDFHAI